MTSGVVIEIATLGGYTLAFGFHEAAGLGLMTSGCAMAMYHAQDLSFPKRLTSSQTFNDRVNKNSDTANTGEKQEHKKPKPGISGKEDSKDRPSWAEGRRPYQSESGKDFAKRLLDEKYGQKKHDIGPNSEFSRIKKYGDRSFE